MSGPNAIPELHDTACLGPDCDETFVCACHRTPVERADIPLETYWSDRTAALAEALHENVIACYEISCGSSKTHEAYAKDALLYLREHGWTLEREETA